MSVKPPSPEDRLEILQLLLDANAELDAVNAAGQTPLILACNGGHAGLAHALLTRGANVDAQVCICSSIRVTFALAVHSQCRNTGCLIMFGLSMLPPS